MDFADGHRHWVTAKNEGQGNHFKKDYRSMKCNDQNFKVMLHHVPGCSMDYCSLDLTCLEQFLFETE